MSEDIVVVGGGPAGATAAWALASAGRSPRLLERDRVPRDKICGEFVSIEAQATLRAMGIDPAALGAPAIDRLRLVHGCRIAETALPFRGFGLSRRAMDAAMLDRAAAAGARIERGVTVRELDGLSLRLDHGRIDAAALVLASGKHDIRGGRRVSRGTVDDLVGFKTYFQPARDQVTELAGHIEIILFPGGYAGLQLVENKRANLCLLIERRQLAATPTWPRLLDRLRRHSGHLDRRLAGGEPLLERPLTIAGLPYGYRYRPRADDLPRLYRVGDQCAVIPSFSGDGMAMAMHSGRSAAEALLRGEAAPTFHARQRTEFRRQVAVADTLYRLARPPALHPMIVEVARRWPHLMARLAGWTRIPADYRSNRAAPSRSISDASWVT